MSIPRMTLVFLFNPSLDHILLIERTHDPYMGRLNGLGGKQKETETPRGCAHREIVEELGIDTKLAHLFNLTLTKNSSAYPARLSVFTGILVDTNTPKCTDVGDRIGWYSVKDVLNSPLDSLSLAGDGIMPYIVHVALRRLKELMEC